MTIQAYAVVVESTGLVENTCEWDADSLDARDKYVPPPGRILIVNDGTAQIGGTWDGNQFLPPPPPDQAKIDADLLVRIGQDMAASDMIVATELLAAMLAALREAVPDFDARLAPAWLAGAATAEEIAAAIVAARKQAVDNGAIIKAG